MSNIRVLRIADVTNLCGISRATVYRLIANDKFPKGRKVSGKAVGWISTEIEEWINTLPKNDY